MSFTEELAPPPRAFVLRMTHGRDRVPEAIKDGFITLGWSDAKGLIPVNDWRTFRKILHDRYYAREASYRRSGVAAGHAWRFLRDMTPGSWVVVPSASRFYVAEVMGGPTYEIEHVADDSGYRRPVRWLNGGRGIDRSLARAALQSRMKAYGTTADASDLVIEIADAVAASQHGGKRPSFDEDLRRRLVDETLREIQSGRMDSYGFERLLAAVLRATGGRSVRIVARSKDEGADIIADYRVAGALAIRVAVQAKHFRKEPPVGKDVLDKLAEGMDAEDATFGVVMTSGTFTDDAIEHARHLEEHENRRIALVNGEQLAAIIVDCGLAQVRVRTDQGEAP